MTALRGRPTLRRAIWPATPMVSVLVAGALMAMNGSALAATTVPLGTAGAYAILAGSGITNTGVTTITGDVGSSPTNSETGFAACPGANCVTLIGANHNSPNPNDAVTQGAKAALTNAYNNAAGQTPAVVLTELAGQTLVGGVYTSASGTFGMSGTLTLDGQNNPNSVFIFQTASTLITGGTGNINLIRGAQACNIFWKIGSAATLGAGSTLRGTVMAHDNISLGSGVTVDGRLFAGEQASGAGAVTLIHDTIIRSVCAAPVPTSTPTPTRTATATPKPTATATPKPTATATPKPTATSTAKPTATSTAKSAVKATPGAKATPGVSGAAGAAGLLGASVTGPQVSQVPRGSVMTGDGSMSGGACHCLLVHQ